MAENESTLDAVKRIFGISEEDLPEEENWSIGVRTNTYSGAKKNKPKAQPLPPNPLAPTPSQGGIEKVDTLPPMLQGVAAPTPAPTSAPGAFKEKMQSTLGAKPKPATTPKPKTPMAEQMENFWDKGSYSVDRNANRIRYRDAKTGDDVTLHMAPGSIPKAAGIPAFEKYLRSLKGEIDTTPGSYEEDTPAAQAATGGTPPPPPPSATPKPVTAASPDVPDPQAKPVKGYAPGAAELYKGKTEAKRTTTTPVTPGVDQAALNKQATEAIQSQISGITAGQDALKEAYGPLLNPDLYSKMGKGMRKAQAQYGKDIDAAQKGEFWDRIIGALGKVTAGTVGLTGIPGVAEKGLDVAKYYSSEPGFDRKSAEERAKTRLEASQAQAKLPLTVAQSLAQYKKEMAEAGMPKADIIARLNDLIKSLTGSMVETEGAESSIDQELISRPPVSGAAAAKDKQGKTVDLLKTPQQEALRDKQSNGYLTARQAQVNSASQAQEAVQQTLVPESTARKIIARLSKTNSRKPGQAEGEYWSKIREMAIAEIEKVQTQDPSDPQSARYSDWDINTRDAAELQDGPYNVVKTSSWYEEGGKRQYDYFDARKNPESRYNVLKTQIRKSQPKLSEQQLEAMVREQLKAEAAQGK
jgi:hypothetical protein